MLNIFTLHTCAIFPNALSTFFTLLCTLGSLTKGVFLSLWFLAGLAIGNHKQEIGELEESIKVPKLLQKISLLNSLQLHSLK